MLLASFVCSVCRMIVLQLKLLHISLTTSYCGWWLAARNLSMSIVHKTNNIRNINLNIVNSDLRKQIIMSVKYTICTGSSN